jgi:hypothetical protein
VIDLGIPARGLAFIRHIETEESYRGGAIVVPVQSRDKLSRQQFVIEAVGDYEFCDDDECERPHTDSMHAHDLREGDWILARSRSWMLTPDPHIFVVRVEDVLGKFEEK